MPTTQESPAPLNEPDYYVQLWGNMNRPAQQRERWRLLRDGSIKFAVCLGVVLAVYFVATRSDGGFAAPEGRQPQPTVNAEAGAPTP
ncbi:MAG: hypothetical protein AAGD35_23055 [Actinomycetota bacterium]